MTLLPDLCILAIVLIAPFREGGREPLALMILHLIVVVFVVGSFWRQGLPRPLPRATIGPAAAALGLAAVAAWRADYPFAAWIGLVDLAVVMAVFLAAMTRGGLPGRARTIRTAVVVAALLQAVLVFVRFRSGGAMAAGVSFLNPNHLAAFLNIGLALALPAAVEAAERWRGAAGPRRSATGRAAIAWGSAILVLLTAALLLGSRGAAVGLLAMCGAFLATRWKTWARPARAAALGILVCLLLAGAARIVLRFSANEDPYRYHRLAIWRAATGMIAERPLFGFGTGMFPHLAPARNFPVDAGPLRYERGFDGAHAAPLTLAVEVGLPAAALAIAAVIGVVTALLRPGAAGPASTAGLGAGLAIVALLAHGGFEDLHRRPALMLIPALQAGTAIGARQRRTLAVARAGFAGWPAAGRAFVVVAIVYGAGLGIVLPWLAHHEAEAARRAGSEGIERMRRAARLNPLHPEYRHDLAMAVLNSGPPTPERYAASYRLLAEARRLKPIDPRFPLLLGRLEALAGDRLFHDGGAVERATTLYREAIRLAPHDPRPRLELAHHLLEADDAPAALREIRAALVVEPHFVRARILEASTLIRMGRSAEAARARALLDATFEVLRGFQPGSGYAREIVEDSPEARARLDALLRVAPASG